MAIDTLSSLQLLDTRAYLAELIQHINRATKRINLISLVLSDENETRELIQSLEAATKRGVSVAIAADVFTFAEFGGYFSPFQHQATESRAAHAMAKRLQDAGATFVWLGSRFKLNPFGGVTHLKWSIIDDTSYCFGGVNLYSEGLKSIDYMLKSTTPELADRISEQHYALTKTSPKRIYPGYKAETDFGTIYIDSGKPGDSMIYERLLELAAQASHVLVTTQYCPSGTLARLLKNKSDVYYNQPRNMEYPAKLLVQYGEIRTGIHSLYQRDTYLHAKFMIFTMPNGKKVAMTGSHNFSYSGVLFGTKEVCLETSDTQIIEQLEAFHNTHVI